MGMVFGMTDNLQNYSRICRKSGSSQNYRGNLYELIGEYEVLPELKRELVMAAWRRRKVEKKGVSS